MWPFNDDMKTEIDVKVVLPPMPLPYAAGETDPFTHIKMSLELVALSLINRGELFCPAVAISRTLEKNKPFEKMDGEVGEIARMLHTYITLNAQHIEFNISFKTVDKGE